MWLACTDQDGNILTTTTDDAGRIATVTRHIAHPEIDPFAFTTITASYTYNTAGRVTQVNHGNGPAVVRQNDAADRLTLIRHGHAGGKAFVELGCVWRLHRPVRQITGPDRVNEGRQPPLIRVTQRQGGRPHLPLWQSFPDCRPRRHYL